MTLPQIGTAWRNDGRAYLIYDITNTLEGNPKFPPRASYMDTLGQRFSRTLDEWNESFHAAEELNFQELNHIRALCNSNNIMLGRLEEAFRQAVLQADRRMGARV